MTPTLREVWLQSYTSRMSLAEPLFCTGCSYDLSHTDRSGACPECGLSIPKMLEARSNRARRNIHANAALTMGVLSLILFPPLGIFAVHYFSKANIDRQHGDCPPKAFRAAVIGLVLGICGLALGIFYLAVLFGP